MVIEPENKGNASLDIRIYECKRLDSGENDVILCKKSEISFDSKTFTLCYKSKKYKPLLVKYPSLGSFLSSNK